MMLAGAWIIGIDAAKAPWPGVHPRPQHVNHSTEYSGASATSILSG
jgi:hypothetical protein